MIRYFANSIKDFMPYLIIISFVLRDTQDVSPYYDSKEKLMLGRLNNPVSDMLHNN